jgi:hypothetical protein
LINHLHIDSKGKSPGPGIFGRVRIGIQHGRFSNQGMSLMEYIVNGNFLANEPGNPFPGWRVFPSVERVMDVGPGVESRNFASFGLDEDGDGEFAGGGRLVQNFQMLQRPATIELSMDIRVRDGSGEAEGDVQVILMLQNSSETPVFHTFIVKEFAQWQTVRLPLNLAGRYDHGAVELLVLHSCKKQISLRKVSLVDTTGGELTGAVKRI